MKEHGGRTAEVANAFNAFVELAQAYRERMPGVETLPPVAAGAERFFDSVSSLRPRCKLTLLTLPPI